MTQLTQKRKIMIALLALGIATMAYEYFTESVTEIKAGKAKQVQPRYSTSNSTATK